MSFHTKQERPSCLFGYSFIFNITEFMAWILGLDLGPWWAACLGPASSGSIQESECVLYTYNPDLRQKGAIRNWEGGLNVMFKDFLLLYMFESCVSSFPVNFFILNITPSGICWVIVPDYRNRPVGLSSIVFFIANVFCN